MRIKIKPRNIINERVIFKLKFIHIKQLKIHHEYNVLAIIIFNKRIVKRQICAIQSGVESKKRVISDT